MDYVWAYLNEVWFSTQWLYMNSIPNEQWSILMSANW